MSEAEKKDTRQHLPPLPFTYETLSKPGAHPGSGVVNLVDGNGRKIGVLWGTPDEKIALAELICDASDRAMKERVPDET